MDRQSKLMQILKESGTWIKSQELAVLLNVSTRTIRQDIKNIKLSYGKDILFVNNTQGYRLNLEIHHKIEQSLQTTMTQSERLRILLKNLIVKQEGINFYELADDLYISTHGLENDIGKLRQLLLYLNRPYTIQRTNEWLCLKGAQGYRNTLLYDCFITTIQDLRLADFRVCFPQIDLKEMYRHLKEIVVNAKAESRYLSLTQLTLVVALTIEQAKRQETATHAIGCPITGVSQLIIAYIETNFDIRLNTAHQISIAYYMNAVYDMDELENKQAKGILDTELAIQQIYELVLAVLKTYHFPKESYDSVLTRLCKHIQLAMKRESFHIQFHNPLANHLGNEHQYLYSFAFQMEQEFKQQLQVQFSLNELSYLVSYYALLMQNERANHSCNLNVALIVEDGYANLTYIANQIMSFAHAGHIRLQTFLHRTDIIDELSFDILLSTNNYIKSAKNGEAIEKNFPRSNQLHIQSLFNTHLYNLRKMQFRKRAQPYFRDSLFFKKKEIANKEEAIRFLCDALYEDGCIDDSYMMKIMEREELLATSIGSGVALPHQIAYPAKKDGAAVLVLKNGLIWGQFRVKLILLLVSPQYDVHFLRFGDDMNQILNHESICQYASECNNAVQFSLMLEYIYANEAMK